MFYKDKVISYRVFGSGPAVVLLHGFAEDKNIWKTFESLSEEYLLIIPDIPGSGNSEPIQDLNLKKGMDEFALAINAVLENEMIGQCSMIGHSMGGYITLAFASLFPEKLNSLGLFHSSSFPDTNEKIETRLKAIEFIRRNGAKAFLKSSIPGLFSEKFNNEHPDKVDQQVKASEYFTDEVLISYYEAMIHRPDRSDILQNFRKPVLFIIGEEDHAIPLESSLKQCHFPSISDINILSEVAHMAMIEAIHQSLTIVKTFLQKFTNLKAV